MWCVCSLLVFRAVLQELKRAIESKEAEIKRLTEQLVCLSVSLSHLCVCCVCCVTGEEG